MEVALHHALGNLLEGNPAKGIAEYEGAPTDGSAWLGGDWITSEVRNGPASVDWPEDDPNAGKNIPGRMRRGASWRNFTFNSRIVLRSRRRAGFKNSNHGFRVAHPVPAGLRDVV